MATELTAKDKRMFESVHRAKTWINEAIQGIIHLELTHTQALQAVNKYLDTSWFKRIPQYKHYEVKGYKEALFSSRFSPLNQHQTIALLFRDLLYKGYDAWRGAFPELPGSELQDTNVIVWKASGKVYYGPEEGRSFGWYLPPSE